MLEGGNRAHGLVRGVVPAVVKSPRSSHSFDHDGKAAEPRWDESMQCNAMRECERGQAAWCTVWWLGRLARSCWELGLV